MAKLVIFPSAGHHDSDPGAIANGYQENKLTKEMRELILQHLEGEKVIIDQDHETNWQYQNRIKPGSGSVILDIHFNSGPESATGTECFVNNSDFQNPDSLSFKMATEITEKTADTLCIPYRGVKSEKDTQHPRIGILNLGAGCAVLWEICFITNAEDMKQYQKYKKELAKEIAEILIRYDAMAD